MRQRLFMPRGEPFKCFSEEEHWLNFGLSSRFPLSFTIDAFMSKPPVQTATRLASASELRCRSALAGSTRTLAKHSLCNARIFQAGQIILFAGEPNFRSLFLWNCAHVYQQYFARAGHGNTAATLVNEFELGWQKENTMAYDEGLAQRIQESVLNHPGMTEKKCLAVLALWIRGNYCCGIIRSELMVRVGAEKYSKRSRNLSHASGFFGKTMRGYVYNIAEDGISSDIGLHFLGQKGLDFTTLPEKAGKKMKTNMLATGVYVASLTRLKQITASIHPFNPALQVVAEKMA
ncbi:MAG: hypothetical protein H6696_17100 [Deferribacteres bacterium]|nr:hypothetical protein [Deferribacteres bacterium]